MSESNHARPRQVTVAAWLIMAGSVFVVLSVFDQVATLHSLETRRSVERFLDEPPGNGLGLTVDAVLDLLRTVAMVAGGCATAAAILGYQVLQRSRSARVALTVLAVPLFLAGLATGGFMSSIVAAAVVMLWFQPARDWFDGVGRPAGAAATRSRSQATPTATATAPPPAQSAPSAPTAPPSPASPSSEPRPYPGFGTAYPPPPPGGSGPAGPRQRPASVVWACALTWVTSGLVAVGAVLSAVVFAVDPGPVMAELRRQQPELAEAGVSQDMLVAGVAVVSGVVVLWCLAAAIVGWFVLRGARWAHVTLLVSASVAGFGSLVGTLLGNPLLLLPLAACVATVGLLAQTAVRAWFAGPATAGGPPPPAAR